MAPRIYCFGAVILKYNIGAVETNLVDYNSLSRPFVCNEIERVSEWVSEWRRDRKRVKEKKTEIPDVRVWFHSKQMKMQFTTNI